MPSIYEQRKRSISYSIAPSIKTTKTTSTSATRHNPSSTASGMKHRASKIRLGDGHSVLSLVKASSPSAALKHKAMKLRRSISTSFRRASSSSSATVMHRDTPDAMRRDLFHISRDVVFSGSSMDTGTESSMADSESAVMVDDFVMVDENVNPYRRAPRRKAISFSANFKPLPALPVKPVQDSLDDEGEDGEGGVKQSRESRVFRSQQKSLQILGLEAYEAVTGYN